jgi:AmpE protein
MTFLIILAAVILVHRGEWIGTFQQDSWFHQLLQRCTAVAGVNFWLPLVGAVLLPVVVLTILEGWLSDQRWLIFIISAVVFFYAIGRGSWRAECDSWVGFFSEPDPVVLKQKLASSTDPLQQDMADETVEQIWLEARSSVLSHQLTNFYAVAFWFFLLGAPAALLYRLLQLYQEKQQAVGSGLADISRLLWLLEWLPVRLVGLLFCLIGNFVTTFWVLKETLQDGVSASAEVLARCADAALFVDSRPDSVEVSKEDRKNRLMERMTLQSAEAKTLGIMRGYSVELQSLLQRAEAAFLAIIALTVLF